MGRTAVLPPNSIADLLKSEITARKKKRGRRKRLDTDGCEGNIPAKPRPWSRVYYTQRENYLASAMTSLPTDEEPRVKILFLDDDQARHDYAHEWLSKILGISGLLIDVHHVHSSAKAIKVLEGEDFDVVSLDHDLEEIHYTNNKGDWEERTGQDVARWLAADSFRGLVIVHSWNPEGAQAMVHILANAKVNVERREFGSK